MAAAYGEQTSTERLIDQKLAAAYGNAEEARKKAIADARSNRAMAQAAYGRNAEALASSGLYRSGVSDYVDAKAYAAERAAAKSAYETEAAARTAADNAYYDAKIAYAEQEKAKEAAEEQSKEAEASTKNQAYLTLVDSAKSGGYSADEIRIAAGKLGITDAADIETLMKMAEDAYGEVEYNKIASSGTITSDTSDDELRGMIDRGELSASKLSQATAERDAQVEADFSVLYQSSGAEAAFNYIDKQFEAGKYSKAEYQETYYNAVVAEIDGISSEADVAAISKKIHKYVDSGKLSRGDADNILAYLDNDNNKGFIFENIEALNHNAARDTITFTIGGKKYRAWESKSTREESKIADLIAPNAKSGTVVVTLFGILVKQNDGWLTCAFNRVGNKDLKSAMPWRYNESIPAHQPEIGPSNGNSTSGGIDVGPIK
jgi:hypothetical protein